VIIYTELLKESPPLSTDEQRVHVAYLTFDERKRGRIKLTTTQGVSAGIQIQRGQILRDNSWLGNDCGDYLHIQAQKEAVTSAYLTDPFTFARACYHLGNRHVQLQIGQGFLRYQRDYVLDQMLTGLGIELTHETAIFEPENGAYHAPHSHSQDDNHEHSLGHHHKH
jgi:urease accessory protein